MKNCMLILIFSLSIFSMGSISGANELRAADNQFEENTFYLPLTVEMVDGDAPKTGIENEYEFGCEIKTSSKVDVYGNELFGFTVNNKVAALNRLFGDQEKIFSVKVAGLPLTEYRNGGKFEDRWRSEEKGGGYRDGKLDYWMRIEGTSLILAMVAQLDPNYRHFEKIVIEIHEEKSDARSGTDSRLIHKIRCGE